MPAESSPSSAEVALLLDLPADIRVAIGRPATGLDGFRRTHVDALTTQRMLSRLVSSWPVARYDDIQLVALMTTDPNRGGEFVADILGHFVGADEDLTKRFQEFLKYGRASGVQLDDYDIPQYTGSLWRQRDPLNSIDEFENALKQSLSDPGITIIDAPADYTRNTDLFAHLHVADLYVSASGTCTPGRQLPLNCGRTGRYIT